MMPLATSFSRSWAAYSSSIQSGWNQCSGGISPNSTLADVNTETRLSSKSQLSLGEEASEWFYELKDQSITSYRQLKQEFLDQYQHSIKKKPTIMDLARMRQGKNQSFEEFVVAWKKVVTYIELSEKELKQMLIKSLRDEVMLEFFNYLE